MPSGNPRPALERLLDKFEITPEPDGCWTWTGGCTGKTNQYGLFRLGKEQRAVIAHRAVYLLLVGPIPEGLHLDHLCRNTLCVNPDHLEPVTQAENNRRQHEANRRDTCRDGHPYEAYIDGSGRRRCRTCRRASFRRTWEKRKAAA